MFSQMRGLTRPALVVFAIIVALPVAPFDVISFWFTRLMLMAVIALIGWSAITTRNAAVDLYLRRFRLDDDDRRSRAST